MPYAPDDVQALALGPGATNGIGVLSTAGHSAPGNWPGVGRHDMRHSLLLLTLIVLAGALGALFLWQGGPSVGDSGPNTAPAEVAEGAAPDDPKSHAATPIVGDQSIRLPAEPLPNSVDPSADGNFLTLRALNRDGQPVPNVEFEWVFRSRLGGTNEGRVDGGATDAAGYLAVQDAPRWWKHFFHPEESEAEIAGYISSVGLRATLPFDGYESTEDDEAPGVLWLRSEPPLDEPLEVILPPFGFVHFQWDAVRDGRGEPLESYFLHIRRSDGDHFPGWRTGFEVTPGATEHVFGPLGLGWEVYGEISNRGVLGSLCHARAPGPTIAGETVPIRITHSKAHRKLVHLHGIAADAAGEAIASRRIRIHFGEPDQSNTPVKSIQTDEFGRWSVNASRETIPPLLYLSLRNPSPERRGTAVIDLGSLGRTGFDAGTVTLTPLVSNAPPPTWLASGRVTTASGAPLAGAWVSANGRATRLDDQDANRDQWTTLSSVRTNQDGRYDLAAVATLSDTKLRVYASHSDYRRIEPVSIELGTSGVDFTLSRGLTVALNVRVEPIFAITEAVSLRFFGPGRDHKPSLMDFMGGYGGTFSGLDEGTYTLQVRLHGGKFALHEQVLAVTDDLDLGTIDITGRLGFCLLQLQDATGAPLEGGYVSVHEASSGTTIDRSSRVDDRGRARIVVPLSCPQIRIFRRGVGYAIVDSGLFVEDLEIDPPKYATVMLRP